MKKKILIIGSTGTLGSRLLSFSKKNDIKINCLVGYKNHKKLNKQKINYNIKYTFLISNKDQKENFLKYLSKTKIDLVYFLDYGAESLKFAKIFLENNKKSIIAIANKELIIAGGNILINLINKNSNILVPLDSEHFSLFNSNIKNDNIQKIYITASGGPFYFKKNINLNKVTFKQVIAHPKWKMGVNNSIDSSNFINKLLEIYELSYIYNIDIKKINFLVSKSAYIHSIIIYNDGSIVINCFKNDMLISLKKPIELLLKTTFINKTEEKYFNFKNFKLEKFHDKRFKIHKYMKFFLNICHSQQINLVLANNLAQKKYISNELKYNEIIEFISNFLSKNAPKKLNSIDRILSYIHHQKINNDLL